MAGMRSIGVFDSGFGGLAILKEVEKRLPGHRYIYLGDTARTPYGTRSPDIVHQFTREAVDFLFSKNCQLVVLACNTASAEALRKLQREYLPKKYPGRRVLGVIVPVVEEAVTLTRNKRIGVIATEGTVASGAFVRELVQRDPNVRVFQQAAPLLVPLVEAGAHGRPFAADIVRSYVAPLMKKNIDTLILGCTHYGLLEKVIRRVVGKDVRIISEGPIVARKLEEYLHRHPEISASLSRRPGRVFCTTDLSDRFKVLGKVFYGKPISPVRAQLVQ